MEVNEKIGKLKKFIVENDLQFTEGRRNSDCTVLNGFALSFGGTLGEVKESINKDIYDTDLAQEIERVYEYARLNNYGLWWHKEDAKKQYKF